jgi:hypothetical protein
VLPNNHAAPNRSYASPHASPSQISFCFWSSYSFRRSGR